MKTFKLYECSDCKQETEHNTNNTEDLNFECKICKNNTHHYIIPIMKNILYRINDIYTTDLEIHFNELQEFGGFVLLDKLDSPSEVVKISDRVTRLSYKYLISGLSEHVELLTVDKIQLGSIEKTKSEIIEDLANQLGIEHINIPMSEIINLAETLGNSVKPNWNK